MTARFSKLATAATIATEEMLDAEWAVRQIKGALADGLQPHDVPAILAACAEIEQSAGEIRAQMAEVGKVERDIKIARRVLNVGWEELWDERMTAECRRERETEKAPNQAYRSEANEAA